MTAVTVGRIVHYHGAFEGPPRAALVVGVTETGAALRVFGTISISDLELLDVPFAEKPTPGHWSWPPRGP